MWKLSSLVLCLVLSLLSPVRSFGADGLSGGTYTSYTRGIRHYYFDITDDTGVANYSKEISTTIRGKIIGFETNPVADADCTAADDPHDSIFTGDGTGYSVYDESTGGSDCSEDYNIFFDFDSGESNHTLGGNSLTSDPLLTSGLGLSMASPAIGAGSGTKEDGSTSDIGAYQTFSYIDGSSVYWNSGSSLFTNSNNTVTY